MPPQKPAHYAFWLSYEQAKHLELYRFPDESDSALLRRLLMQLQRAIVRGTAPNRPKQAKNGNEVEYAFWLDTFSQPLQALIQTEGKRQPGKPVQAVLERLVRWACRLPLAAPLVTPTAVLEHLQARFPIGTLLPITDVLGELGLVCVNDQRVDAPAKQMLWQLHQAGDLRLHSVSPHATPSKRGGAKRRLQRETETRYGFVELQPQSGLTALSLVTLCDRLWRDIPLPSPPWVLQRYCETIAYAIVPDQQLPTVTLVLPSMGQTKTFQRLREAFLSSGFERLQIQREGNIMATFVRPENYHV